MNDSAAQRDRRRLFTTDVEAYDAGRPGYPDRVFELLGRRCGLEPGCRVLEIGPGTGQATGRLLDLGASVTAVELGVELADRLRTKHAGRPLTVRVGAFEEVDLAPSSVDLVVAATSFHWVPTEIGLQRCADVLRPGGWLALWWTFFGDPDRPDPFSDALDVLLAKVAPELLDPPESRRRPYALDVAARCAEIDASGWFEPVQHEVIAWTGRHDAPQLRQLFASYSPWLALPPARRKRALDAVARLANEDFAGVVERPYLTPTYLARRERRLSGSGVRVLRG